ncbi:Gfo/Idh/MocA family oxidoreductase [Sinomicrobium kalidii]|uniref:Gfo/Idh/MocA family protein n=1 Tax=Sinomicrobium kalidii TaxID=2900738 RepID=UPI001E2B6899|nr:Gfo/Idh/MocA family oxidoreductase [Sinomicrobium kalidii]UGU14210.1 Gfo/Idh/MocA family oxidoreductase [Sinomicrobium kalidii]
MDEKNGKSQSKPSNSRRNFIKSASVAAAGFYIVPRHVLGGTGFTAPSDKLLIAGVGAGGKGGDDIRKFAEAGNAEIAFLCDVDDRQAKKNRKLFPKAKYYKDWRELFDKEGKHFDAVSVGTPDHTHAIVAFNAMKMGKHVYVQKPLTHDIHEAYMLGEAAKKYKVVTQMGDQGSSNDGIRILKEWYEAGLIGEVHTINCWTDRPVWPQGIKWPNQKPPVPAGLDWDLWLGTAPYREYEDMVVPFNWRGWWDYGTGALGDMACHIVGPVFKVMELGFPTDVNCSVSTPYVDNFKAGYFPDSAPLSSSVHFTYKGKNGEEIKLNWMDGGIQPERPEELGPNEIMGGHNDLGNGVIFEGTKGKMMCGVYGDDAQLLPTSRTEEVNVPQKYKRIPGQAEGHYKQWVDACIAGYGKQEVDSPFVGYAVPLTQSILMGNLAIRSFNYRKEVNGKITYPGRGITLEWDGVNRRVTNFEAANQYVKRNYREGWPDLKL